MTTVFSTNANATETAMGIAMILRNGGSLGSADARKGEITLTT